MKALLVKLAAFINEKIVGSVWTFLACILFVVIIYVLLAVQGYSKWNSTTGLFSNTAESSFELITGVGAVVAVVSLHKSHKDLHKKVDELNKGKKR